ncbi:hypothetical protein HZ326_16589 [Fusarium oxysporum f. sp. albedinis]|nr:hypothetical protein HZ326_16589 [Fusarium oxysporum f. sp. albedinis]
MASFYEALSLKFRCIHSLKVMYSLPVHQHLEHPTLLITPPFINNLRVMCCNATIHIHQLSPMPNLRPTLPMTSRVTGYMYKRMME